MAGGKKLRAPHFVPCHLPPVTLAAPKHSEGGRHLSAFTLIEMLVVITILGILAGLAVPALKNISKSDSSTSAARQLLDDFGHARQLAISHHTTVYMVFVPANFWLPPFTGSSVWVNGLTVAQQTAVTNLCDKQLSGYTFIGTGAVGDQPGRHAWHYLAPWHNLPDGSFIAQQKFQSPGSPYYPITDAASGAVYKIYGFDTNNIPFPLETSGFVNLPYVAFNYLGQLTTAQLTPAPSTLDEYIPLARGSVSPAMNTDKSLLLGSPSISETPPGNSTNSSYNIIHIDALTGRARLEFQKLP
jgi:prepilin-type N-terminal cleavage/methylation domain-containing protein